MMHDSWFYYFSSLAQTIAAGSALLVALAVIRLQALANSLNAIEGSIAKAFFKIGRQSNYRRQAAARSLAEDWSTYFADVERVIDSNQELFSTESYTESKDFLDSLVSQGRQLDKCKRQLHHALALAFGGTVLFAGAAILVLPAAKWISPSILSWSWGLSGILLVALFMLYFRLVLSSLKSK